MTITTIHYEARKSDGSYGNRCLSMTAQIDEGEDIEAACAALRVRVTSDLEEQFATEKEDADRVAQERERRFMEGQRARLDLRTRLAATATSDPLERIYINQPDCGEVPF